MYQPTGPASVAFVTTKNTMKNFTNRFNTNFHWFFSKILKKNSIILTIWHLNLTVKGNIKFKMMIKYCKCKYTNGKVKKSANSKSELANAYSARNWMEKLEFEPKSKSKSFLTSHQHRDLYRTLKSISKRPLWLIVCHNKPW